jgi:hypothetical protein
MRELPLFCADCAAAVAAAVAAAASNIPRSCLRRQPTCLDVAISQAARYMISADIICASQHASM